MPLSVPAKLSRGEVVGVERCARIVTVAVASKIRDGVKVAHSDHTCANPIRELLDLLPDVS